MRWAAAAAFLLLSPAAEAACPSKDAVIAATAPDGQVVALVRAAPITSYDWQQAVALRVALDGGNPDASALKRIAAEELARLKANQAWLAEARRRDIAVVPAEVDAAIAAVLRHDHVTAAGLDALLKCSGVARATLRGRVAAAIAQAKATGMKVTLPFRIAQHG